MMKNFTFIKIVAVAAIILVNVGMSNAQNLLTNGNLETWTAGSPDNWSHVENITQEGAIKRRMITYRECKTH